MSLFRLSSAILAATIFSGCSTPAVDVKAKWNATLKSYRFVPTYPPRSGIDVGDVRIHRINEQTQTFDSRLISEAGSVSGLVPWAQMAANFKPERTVLPGVEAIRISALDASVLGFKFLSKNTSFETQQELSILLGKLITEEIATKDVLSSVTNRLVTEIGTDTGDLEKNPTALAICADAITMGDPELKDTAISVITRVFKAGSISYYYGSGAGNVKGAAAAGTADGEKDKIQNAVEEAQGGGQGIIGAISTGLKIDAPEIGDDPVTIGLDAIMIRPTGINPKLSKFCKSVADRGVIAVSANRLGLR